MKYQPENFKNCQSIQCNDCIISNSKICVLTLYAKKLTKLETKILVDKRFWEIIKYNENRMREIEKYRR